ncbi:MAG: rod shape-determining protein MreC [Chloroflexota bacterium]|nr:rod shape-determining protein MreC [Chloroflexota bacterium]
MGHSRQRAVVIILILLLVLSWLLFDQLGDRNPIQDVLSRLLSPIQFALQRAMTPFFHMTDRIAEFGVLNAENKALREEIAVLRKQIILLKEAQIENETLRRQLDFKVAAPNYHVLSAQVIGHDPTNLLQYLVIDRGAEDGIEAGMPVVVAEGLVGRISEVSAASSKVMLISNPSSSVSALIQRSRATGVVQGRGGHVLSMRYIPQGDTVVRGDVVLTSGLGGNFPKRLVIGQVESVQYKEVEMFQEARMVPAVRLHDLEVVMVILNFTPIDVVDEGG